LVHAKLQPAIQELTFLAHCVLSSAYLRTRAIPERLIGVFTTRRYANPRLPLPYLNTSDLATGQRFCEPISGTEAHIIHIPAVPLLGLACNTATLSFAVSGRRCWDAASASRLTIIAGTPTN